MIEKKFSPTGEEVLSYKRRSSAEKADKTALVRNKAEGRSRLKGVFSKDRRPLQGVDILQEKAQEEDTARGEKEKNSPWFFSTSIDIGEGRAMQLKLGRTEDAKEEMVNGTKRRVVYLPLKIEIEGHSINCKALVIQEYGRGMGHEKPRFSIQRGDDYYIRDYFPQHVEPNFSNLGVFFQDLPKDLRELMNNAWQTPGKFKEVEKEAAVEAQRYNE